MMAGRRDEIPFEASDPPRRECLSDDTRDRMVAIVEASPDCVCVANLDCIPRYINRAGRQLLGLADNDPVPSGPSALGLERGGADGLRHALATGQWSGETTIRCQNGQEIAVWVMILVHRGADGQPAFLSLLIRPLAETRQLEAQLRQSQKMETLGRLAAGVAHDFNNLLTIISGYTELLLRNQSILAGVPGERRPGNTIGNDRRMGSSSGGTSTGDFMSGYLQQIRKAGEQAASLTRQLLAFSRQQSAPPILLDPSLLVQNLDKMLRRFLGEEVQLTTHTSPDIGLVRADPGQLEQVLFNLVVNARDAILDRSSWLPCRGKTPAPNGQVTITLTATDPRDDDPKRFVCLSVKDNGCGMSEEVKTQLFEPFFTTKAENKGTGLGLAMVHSIISQHKGHVVVDSTLGQGTTFHIYLPRIDADQPRMESKVPADRLNGTESILIVEDESQLRKLAGEALRVHGYKIHEAGSSIEALERLASLGSIDLVLTDVVMPGLSGRALADELSRRCPGVRIVFMSGYTEDAVIRHGVQSETVHFLQKPFTPHVLVRKVREVLDRSPVRTAFPVPSTNCQPSVRAE